MISPGWTNPTPWNTFRELPEKELAKRVDELVAKVTGPSRTIFNFHAPPYRGGLDEAPGPDENLNMKASGRAIQPVGSASVRTSPTAPALPTKLVSTAGKPFTPPAAVTAAANPTYAP